MIEYYMNKDKRTIVARLLVEETGDIFIGKSKCYPTDKWDPAIGTTVARLKALKKFYKFECNEAFDQFMKATALQQKAKAYAVNKSKALKNIEELLKKYQG